MHPRFSLFLYETQDRKGSSLDFLRNRLEILCVSYYTGGVNVPYFFTLEFVMKRQQKKDVMVKFQKHPKDTGSASVQIAILTKRIDQLTAHLQSNKKDFHSRRGLYQMVGKRRKLMVYEKNNNPEVYKSLVEELGIRG